MNADVVVVDATERFMYVTPADGLPRDMLHVCHLVEDFVREKIRRVCTRPPKLVVVLMDDSGRVPLEKHVAHAVRYSKRPADYKPLQMEGAADGSQDVTGTEFVFPWDDVAEDVMAKGAPAAWRELITLRATRQRMAKFVTARLRDSSTLGLPAGAKILISGPCDSPAEPQCWLATVAATTDKREVVQCPVEIMPSMGAGEADIKTPLLLRWVLEAKNRARLGLPAAGAVVAIVSKDTDMVPILMAQQAADIVARRASADDNVCCCREKYERVSKRWTRTTINVSCIARGVVGAKPAGQATAAVMTLLFRMALCGCDFVKRPKAFSTQLALSQTGDSIFTAHASATAPTVTMRVTCSATAARQTVQRVWSGNTRCTAAAECALLSQSLQLLKQSRGGGRYRITDKDKSSAEAMWRAAVWVAHYWMAPALGPASLAVFARTMCCGPDPATSSGCFGFAVSTRHGKPTVTHGSETDTKDLEIPTTEFPHDTAEAAPAPTKRARFGEDPTV